MKSLSTVLLSFILTLLPVGWAANPTALRAGDKRDDRSDVLMYVSATQPGSVLVKDGKTIDLIAEGNYEAQAATLITEPNESKVRTALLFGATKIVVFLNPGTELKINKLMPVNPAVAVTKDVLVASFTLVKGAVQIVADLSETARHQRVEVVTPQGTTDVVGNFNVRIQVNGTANLVETTLVALLSGAATVWSGPDEATPLIATISAGQQKLLSGSSNVTVVYFESPGGGSGGPGISPLAAKDLAAGQVEAVNIRNAADTASGNAAAGVARSAEGTIPVSLDSASAISPSSL